MPFNTLNNRNFKSYNFKFVIIDVNSLFLFSSFSLKKLYNFIDELRLYFGNDLYVINVIDNGQNKKLTRKYKDYKANRFVSQYDSNMLRIQNRKNKYKYNINRIFHIDSKFSNNLTFYYEGESDFKIGFILKYLNSKYNINKSEILVVSKDKDLIIANMLSCVLIKTFRKNKIIYYFFDDNVNELNEYMADKLKCYKFKYIYEFFYYLILSGDKIDNIPKICRSQKEICHVFKNVYSRYNNINLDIISNILNDMKIDTSLLYKNYELIDIFNPNAFTKQQYIFMSKAIDDFLNR